MVVANPEHHFMSLQDFSSQLYLSKDEIRCLYATRSSPMHANSCVRSNSVLTIKDYYYWTQGIFSNGRKFLKKIIFTDEVTFANNKIVCQCVVTNFRRQNIFFEESLNEGRFVNF